MQWLEQRLTTAAAVSVLLLQTDPATIPQSVQDDVLMAAGVKAIAVREHGVSRLMVVTGMPPEVDEHIDLDAMEPWQAVTDAADTLSSAATARSAHSAVSATATRNSS